MNQLSMWAKEPTRIIHAVLAVLLLAGAIIGDLTNALNGTETWFGVAIAIANVVQGEINRSQVVPAKASGSADPIVTPGVPTPGQTA